MKKVLLIFLAAIFLMTSLAGCGNDSNPPQSTPVSTPASTPDTPEGQEVYVTLDTLWGTLSYYEDDGTGTKVECSTGAYVFTAHSGQSVAQTVAASGVTDLAAHYQEDTLEGWITYKENVTVDEDGYELTTLERMGDTLCTLEEIMTHTVPDYSVTYVAKWESVAYEDYYVLYEKVYNDFGDEDISSDYYLLLYSNGGIIYIGEEEPYDDITMGGYALANGLTLGYAMEEPIQRVEKEGATFTGWSIFTAASYLSLTEAPESVAENEYCINLGEFGFLLLTDYQVYSENATTEELTSLICGDIHYVAIPNWAE